MGAIFGSRKATTAASKAASAVRGIGRMQKQSQQAGFAEQTLDSLKEQYAELEAEFEQQQLIALVLVDLLTRIDRAADAVEIAKDYLSNVEEPQTFSFAQLCQEHQRWDLLEKSARDRGDLVLYTATLLSGTPKA